MSARLVIFLFLAGCAVDEGAREKAIVAACDEACGRVQARESSTIGYPCMESVSITIRAGSSDIACRCSCSIDAGVREAVWR